MQSRLDKQCGGRMVCVPMIDGIACKTAGKVARAWRGPGSAGAQQVSEAA
jgi:hypothetical protein